MAHTEGLTESVLIKVDDNEHVKAASDPSESDNEDEEDVYEVEKIVGYNKIRGKPHFKVRWLGYGPASDTWEPRENLDSCISMVDDYLANMEKEKQAKVKERKEKKKRTVGSYEYTTETTLKDTFWEDLQEGKINVFDGDLYSKVKGQGRAARSDLPPQELEEESSAKRSASTTDPGPSAVQDVKRKRSASASETKTKARGRGGGKGKARKRKSIDTRSSIDDDNEINTVDASNNKITESEHSPAEVSPNITSNYESTPSVGTIQSSDDVRDSGCCSIVTSERNSPYISTAEDVVSVKDSEVASAAHSESYVDDQDSDSDTVCSSSRDDVESSCTETYSESLNERDESCNKGSLKIKIKLKDLDENGQKRYSAEPEVPHLTTSLSSTSVSDVKIDNKTNQSNLLTQGSSSELKSHTAASASEISGDEVDSGKANYFAVETPAEGQFHKKPLLATPFPEPCKNLFDLVDDDDKDYEGLENDLEDVDLDQWDSTGCDSLTIPVRSGDISSAEFRHAVRLGDSAKVCQALSSGNHKNVECPDSTGMTLLMLAAQNGYDDIVEQLAMHGADINTRQKNGFNPLIHACDQGHVCCVSLLLEMGGHMNVQLQSGETALMRAIKKGYKQIVKLLLDHGVNISLTTSTDMNAFKLAKTFKQMDICDMLNSHITRLTSVFEVQVTLTLNNTAKLLEKLFPLHCLSLCEDDVFRISFKYELQPTVPGIGTILFISHSKISPQDVKCRLHGHCAVKNVVLNGVVQAPLTEEANFVMSFSPLHNGQNNLEIHTVSAPRSQAKLLVCAYKAQLLQSQ